MLAVGVDTDCQEGDIYWTDAAMGVIRRAKLNGTGVETVITGIIFNILFLKLFPWLFFFQVAFEHWSSLYQCQEPTATKNRETYQTTPTTHEHFVLSNITVAIF